MRLIASTLILLLVVVPGSAIGTVLPTTTTRPLILIPARLASMQAKYSTDHASWTYLKTRADTYLTGDITALYSGALGQIAAAQALVYLMNSDTTYLNRARDILWARYFDPSSTVKWDYTNRNGFRAECMWAALTFDWLYNDLSVADRLDAQTQFKTWGQYWESYIGYPGWTSSFDPADSDEGTSLTANMQLLAMVLYNDDAYASTLFDLADNLKTAVTLEYMNTYMKGGVWAEGNDYSYATMGHWVLQFMIDSESRGITFPNTYLDQAIKSQIHMLYPAWNGVYLYGDNEAVTSNYRAFEDDHRYNFMLYGADSSAYAAQAQYWLAQATPPTSNYYGAIRFLFEKSGATAASPASAGWDTGFISDGSAGQQFVSWRTGWGPTDTAIFFRNSKYTVDHVQKDSLDFALVRGSDVLTKECTGYASTSATTTAHNAVLIENADSGNSSPVYRPKAYGTTKTDFGSGYVFIKADATDHYNMSGYFYEDYADLVQRQIVFAPPYMVMSDRIIISSDSDCSWSGSTSVGGHSQQCAPRWKKVIQHFMGEPSLSGGVYSAAEGTSKLFYKSIYPATTITKVDESILWSASTESAMPTNQRKWHLSIAPAVDADSVDFLNVMYMADSSVTEMPASTLIVGTGGRGTLIGGTTVAMFTDSQTGADITSLSYSTNTSATSTHYIADLTPSAEYSVSIDGGTATSHIASYAGLIVFSNESTGSQTYAITLSGTPPLSHSRVGSGNSRVGNGTMRVQ